MDDERKRKAAWRNDWHNVAGRGKGAARARRDVLANELAALDNAFDRLLWLAASRDLATDKYRHWGLEFTYGAEVAQAALLQLHREVFREVEALTLRKLEEQIRWVLAGHKDGGRILAANWRICQLGGWLAPPNTRPLLVRSLRAKISETMTVIDRGWRRAKTGQGGPAPEDDLASEMAVTVSKTR